MTKMCKKCGVEKDMVLFSNDKSRSDGKNPYCKQCRAYIDRIYYLNNKDKLNKISKLYYLSNKIDISRKSSEYYRENKENRLLYQYNYRISHKQERNEHIQNRRKEDIVYKLSELLRTRFYMALKNNQKSGSAIKDLGCSVEELKQWLEQQFENRMTWENYGNGEGKWNIDHIYPLSKVDLTNRKQLKKVCHWFNLRPMWSKENTRKGANINAKA